MSRPPGVTAQRAVAPAGQAATASTTPPHHGQALESASAGGALVLPDASLGHLQIVAHGLSKSVVLAHQETAIAAALDRIEPFVLQLRDRGGVVTRDTALLRQVDHILSALQRMAVRVEAEDKPDLLWDHPELDRLYARLPMTTSLSSAARDDHALAASDALPCNA